MKRAIALSMVDQGALSAQSFLFGFFLMRQGDADAVGRYALAMSTYFIVLSIQTALVGTPLMTQIYGRSVEAQVRIMRVVCTFDLHIVLGSVLATVILLSAIGFDSLEVVAAAAVVTSGMLRELSRTIAISTGDMRRCLRVDLTAVFVSLAVLWPLTHVVSPEIACLAGLAIGNLVAVVLFGRELHIVPREAFAAFGNYRPHFEKTRWALLGGAAAVFQTRAFFLIVGALRGIGATGVIEAGRLVISPVSLIGDAWGRIAVPRMSAHFRGSNHAHAYAIMFVSMAVLSAVAISYFLCVYLAWGLLEEHLFRGKYPQVHEIAIGWAVVTLVTQLVRCIGWTFTANQRFRELGLLGTVNAVVVAVFMLVLALPVPLYTALAILTVSQLSVGVSLIWIRLSESQPREAAA